MPPPTTPMPTAMPTSLMPRLLLIGEERLLHDLLRGHLGRTFEVVGETCGHAGALDLARTVRAHVVLVDADVKDTDPAELVAGLVLISPAPVVTLSAPAGPGSAAAAALLLAGAFAVLHKPAGRLPLDLSGDFGDALVTALVSALRLAVQPAEAGG